MTAEARYRAALELIASTQPKGFEVQVAQAALGAPEAPEGAAVFPGGSVAFDKEGRATHVDGVPIATRELEAPPVVPIGDKWPGAVTDGLSTRCSYCGIKPAVDYRASDDEWKRVVPSEHRPGVVCLECFIDILGGNPATLLEVQVAGHGHTAVAPISVVYQWGTPQEPDAPRHGGPPMTMGESGEVEDPAEAPAQRIRDVFPELSPTKAHSIASIVLEHHWLATREPDASGEDGYPLTCAKCSRLMHEHGWEGGKPVCPEPGL